MSERENLEFGKHTGSYYPMQLAGMDANGQRYGLQVLESGEVEYFGDYDPDSKSRELHRHMGRTMAQIFPRVPNLQTRDMLKKIRRPPPVFPRPCCERDHDADGNCDVHPPLEPSPPDWREPAPSRWAPGEQCGHLQCGRKTELCPGCGRYYAGLADGPPLSSEGNVTLYARGTPCGPTCETFINTPCPGCGRYGAGLYDGPQESKG